MTENEVNEKCKEWLLANDYKYKGVCNTSKEKPGKSKLASGGSKDTGFGDVPVPDGNDQAQVLIDHQGVKDRKHEIIWVEAKGGDSSMSDLLQGFIRMVYACYWGGGSGLLAVPSAECQRMLQQRDFLKRVSVSCERRIGVLDAGTGKAYWL